MVNVDPDVAAYFCQLDGGHPGGIATEGMQLVKHCKGGLEACCKNAVRCDHGHEDVVDVKLKACVCVCVRFVHLALVVGGCVV